MKIIKKLDQIEKPFQNAVITIGNFDGVHIGHQALFHQTIQRADAIAGTSVAVTFDPHPTRVLTPDKTLPLITIFEQKTELVERAGIDVLVCIPFNREFASISARAFVVDLLIEKLGMRAIVVGKDYVFGKDRQGNIQFLRELGEVYDFQVIVVDWVNPPSLDTHRISSTIIRELVMDGDVEQAQKLLGRFYQIRGIVQKGRNRGGRLLGFPTANINLADELCPKTGVYAVCVDHEGEKFKGVANIGYSPTFDDHIFTVEVHILDFNQDLYNQKIKVNFIKRLRDEKKFSGIDQLSEQIKKDIKAARAVISL